VSVDITHTAVFDSLEEDGTVREGPKIKMIVMQTLDLLRGPSVLVIQDVDGGPLVELSAEEVYEFLRGCNI
jgi:hypothetical protein